MPDEWRSTSGAIRRIVEVVGGPAAAARRSGYSVKYVRWAAGLIGKRPWPGSYRMAERFARLGQSVGIAVPVPPRKAVLVIPCTCGHLHMHECALGRDLRRRARSEDPTLLGRVQRVAAWLGARERGIVARSRQYDRRGRQAAL